MLIFIFKQSFAFFAKYFWLLSHAFIYSLVAFLSSSDCFRATKPLTRVTLCEQPNLQPVPLLECAWNSPSVFVLVATVVLAQKCLHCGNKAHLI